MPPKRQNKQDIDLDDDSGMGDMTARGALVRAYTDYIKHKVHNLNAEYWRFITRTSRKPMALSDGSNVWDVYLKWHEYQLEKHDKEDFSGIDDEGFGNTKGEYKQPSITASEPDVFKNFTILESKEASIDLKTYQRTVSLWNMRLSNKVNNKLKTLDVNKRLPYLEAIFALQLGLMNDASIMETGPILYLAGFSKVIKGSMTIVFALVPERVPVVKTILNKTHIVGFRFRQYLRIIDIVFSSDKKQAYESYQTFVQHIQDDPDKWNPFIPSNFLESESGKSVSQGGNFELLDIKNIIQYQTDPKTGLLVYMPALSNIYKMSTIEVRSFHIQSMGRWVSDMEESKFSFKLNNQFKNLNKMIIEKCTSEESCAWLLEFLEKIPNFNLRLTNQEKRLITTPGNVLCIGRSGTGKTTSAVLRLFALEILFKIRSSLFLKEGQSLKASNFTADDAQSATGLHSVIVTASPVLTNEIRRFYTSLKNKVIGELKKREERKQAKLKAAAEGQVEEKSSLVEEIQMIDTNPKEEAEIQIEDQEQELVKEDEILDIEEMERNMKLAQSMADMRNEDFPAFLTIKRLVYMIDASVNRPFFARNIKNEIIGLDSQAEWHNEQKGVLMINNYYKIGQEGNGQAQVDDIEKFMNLSSDEEDGDDENDEEEEGSEDEVREQAQKSAKKRTKFFEGERVVQDYAQEVDYDLFERKFWPKYFYNNAVKNVTPSMAWTEIFSVIKGSNNSADFSTKALPRSSYATAANRKTILSQHEKDQIYSIYEKYEIWKQQIKGFDFMDIVNHILRELQGVYYKGTPIHFMLVDEVQDLTPATIRLLLKVTEQNIYFAGDTAQTIAKGVGFRFCDLKQMLNMTDFDAPKVLQLTVNFRSHNRILNLANSIISAVEIFFPQTIDKLIKERSDIDGLKPIVLDSALLENLFYILLGKQKSQSQGGLLSGDKESGGPAEFGCDQVIIVRDQESKKRVPSVLQHALCLTVYECKGLEFDDVILYNFFTDAPQAIHEQWKLINSLSIERIPKKEEKLKSKDEGNQMQDLDDLNFDNVKSEEQQEVTTNVVNEHTSGQYDEVISLNNRSLHKGADNFYKEFSSLCTDLKQLYVCVTRPKKRLIIYDEDPSRREIATNYWLQLDAVDVITEEMLSSTPSSTMTEEQMALLSKLKERDEVHPDSEARRKGWRAQGIKMFKRRYYEQAMKCFEHSGDQQLKQRARAYSLAEDAAKVQSEAESIQYRLDDQYKNLDKQQRRQMKLEIDLARQKSITFFQAAAAEFIQIDLKKQAAQCLYTAQQYEKAAKLFEEIGFYSQAGEAFYTLGEYSRAAMLYSEGGMVSKAVDCYKKLKNWDAILQCVKTHEQYFTQEQREQLIKKYVPLALNSLYTLMTADNMVEGEDSDEEQKVLNPRDVVVKDYEVQTMKSVIKEESSEEEDQEEDEGVQSEKSEDILTNQSQIECESIKQLPIQAEPAEPSDVDNFVLIDTTKPDKEKAKIALSESDNSFSIISSQQKESEVEPQDQFEHLSQYDPEDEFLRCSSRTVSVIESVMSGAYKQREGKSELSDYSIIQDDDKSAVQNENMLQIIKENVNLIKTRRDIYAEDVLMTKIIYYVSQFSQDVQSYLNRFRSKEALPSAVKYNPNPVVKSEMQEINTEVDNFDYDLDQVTPDFLNILLDCLESFELYKLCLIVCNRYQLTSRVGRYLVSIANKYSNLPQIATQFVNMFHPQHREVQGQVSFVAHQALHSALELIEPKFLKIKEGQMDSNNSLGQYCFTGLLNHGFWKKLLYLMDLKSSLNLASAFVDFRAFRQLYLAFAPHQPAVISQLNRDDLITLIKADGFMFIEHLKTPKSEYEQFALIAGLDSILWSDSIREDVQNRLKDILFPECFSLAQQALEITNKFSGLNQEERNTKQESLIVLLQQRISRISMRQKISPHITNDFSETCYLYDTSVALFLLIQNPFSVSAYINTLQYLEPEVFQTYLRALNKFLHMTISNNYSIDASVRKILLQGMLSVLRVRLFTDCASIYDNYMDKVLVHYTSSLSQSLSEDIEKKKKAVADAITREVFAEMDPKWNTKQEINREVKKRLRSRYQREALNSMIEIIDLEATFIRAPLSIILEMVQHRITSYIKHSTERSIELIAKEKLALNAKSELQCFDKKEDLDEVDSPFEVQDRFLRIIALYNSTLEIQKFIENKNVSLKQLVARDEKLKILAVDSIEYHLRLEEQEKQEKELKRKEYMVKVGLMNKRELEQYKQHLKKKQEKEDNFFLNQGKYLKNIASLSLFNFEPLNKGQLDMQTHQNLLDMAYRYWELFRQTVAWDDDESCGELEFAMTSLGLYIAADHYIYFMQMLQAQLHPKSAARKLLFHLIDSHIYKKHGHLLESSNSLLIFIKDQHILGGAIEYYYQTIFTEVALVHLLATKNKPFYLTFEQVRHLSHMFGGINNEVKSEFGDQVANYFAGEEYGDESIRSIVTLKLNNSKFYIQGSPEDAVKHKQCLKSILKQLEYQVSTWSASKLLHTFLCIFTLLINETSFCVEERLAIETILNKLVDEGILDEDAYVFSHGNDYKALVTEFLDSDYASQNEVLYLEKRGAHQSIWVKVEITNDKAPAELRDQIKSSLAKADEDEIVLLSQYQRVSDLFRQVYKTKKQNLKKQLTKKVEMLTLRDHLLLEELKSRKDFEYKEAVKNLPLLRRLSDMSKFIRNVTMNSKLDNVIDLHYLLNQIHRIESSFIPRLICEQPEFSSLDTTELADINQEVSDLENQIRLWSENKSQGGFEGGNGLRNQRIMKLKWREQAIKMRQKIIAKVAAKKKDDAYVKKRLRIKGRL